MAIERPNPFEQLHHVALYKSLHTGATRVAAYYRSDDEFIHAGEVRISEPAAVTFTTLSNDETIQNALKSLDGEERSARLELEKRMGEIKQQRASLLALSHEKVAT